MSASMPPSCGAFVSTAVTPVRPLELTLGVRAERHQRRPLPGLSLAQPARRSTIPDRPIDAPTFLSVWKVYDRRNVAQFYCNAETGREAPIRQWGRLPVFGLEWAF